MDRNPADSEYRSVRNRHDRWLTSAGLRSLSSRWPRELILPTPRATLWMPQEPRAACRAWLPIWNLAQVDCVCYRDDATGGSLWTLTTSVHHLSSSVKSDRAFYYSEFDPRFKPSKEAIWSFLVLVAWAWFFCHTRAACDCAHGSLARRLIAPLDVFGSSARALAAGRGLASSQSAYSVPVAVHGVRVAISRCESSAAS
jgi:hypothetical protein